MSTDVMQFANAMPAVNIPADIYAKSMGYFTQAIANSTTGLPRLSFGGKTFNLSFGGNTIELQERVLDVYIVAVNPQSHYTFYSKAYTGTDNDKDIRIMSRYPTPDDPFEFTPTSEWVQRAFKQRCVIMLANDPEHKLYVVDFGYNSIKRVGNPQLGVYSLTQILSQMEYVCRNSQGLLPCLLTVQLSFTKASVAEVQFSLADQRSNERRLRIADTASANAIIAALSNGEVDQLLNIEFDSGDFGGSHGANQAPQQQSYQQPASIPQPPTQQMYQQPPMQPAASSSTPFDDMLGDELSSL